MAQTASNALILQAIGSFCPIAMGCAGGSGTSTVVTIPQFKSITNVVVSSATSATGAFVATISTNTFTCTTANNDLFTWIAWGKGGI